MRSRSIAPILLFPGVLACATGVDPLGPREDAGVQEQPDAAPPVCAPGVLPDSLTASPGGRLELTLSPPEGARIEVGVPDGWRLDDSNPSRISVRVPYSASGEPTLAVTAVCDEQRVESAIPVSLTPLSWSSVASWDSGTMMAPKPRQFASMWFDIDDPDRLLIYGGVSPNGPLDDLWAYLPEASKWDLLSPHSDTPILESGPVSAIPNEPAALFVDSLSGWAGSGTTFTMLRLDYGGEIVELTPVESTNAPPAASEAGAFLYDSKSGRYVYACGISNSALHCRVDVFDPASGSWEEPAVEADGGAVPSGRYGFASGYDEPNERMIIFSGGQDPTAANPVNPADDAWALELGGDPLRWVKLPSAGDAIPGRRNSCSAIDPIGHRMFVWGGTPDLMTVTPGLYALDLDRGFESWTRVDIAGEPPPRSGCAAAYDPARRRILFGFGNTRTAIYTDLHALNL